MKQKYSPSVEQLQLWDDQTLEGRQREFLFVGEEYPELGDPDETPFTVEGTYGGGAPIPVELAPDPEDDGWKCGDAGCPECADPQDWFDPDVDDPEELNRVGGSPAYLALLDEMRDLHIRKNAGYAGADNPDPWANFRMSEDFGVSASRGVMVRLSDKYARTINLMRDPNNERVGESLRETLIDLAAYALIEVCVLEEEDAG